MANMSIYDFIAHIFIPFSSICLVYCTYTEQRRTNLISRFESSFWKIGGNNARYNSNCDRELQCLTRLIDCHFCEERTKISKSQLCCLLNFYWKQIETNENSLKFSFKPYFVVLETRLNYIFTQSGKLIDSSDIKFYVNTVLSELPQDALLPFYSFVCSEVYSQKLPVSVLSYISPEIMAVIEIEESTGDCKILPYSHDEDYGYSYSECQNEPCTETIKKLNIN